MYDDEDVDVDEADGKDWLLAAVARIPVHVEPAEWTPPPELDEYRLIKPLGRGGMGSVWLANDRLLDRLVAVKFIAHAEPDKQTRDRFAIEARAAARLQHPNVVSVYRYGELSGRPYLVSEYIRGDSLDKLAKPVAWERVLDLGIALSRGLAAAHRHGIVHRDIKPANAILSVDGDAKLVDFGLARLDRAECGRPAIADDRSRPADPALTAPGAVAGTPRYLAPEVRHGEPAGRRSDVYGIGCVLYELVTGRAPILDLAAGSTLEGGRAASESHDVPSIASRIETAGAKLAAIIDRCLRPDPEQRYASGDELREALEQIRMPVLERGELPEGNPYRGLVPYDAEHHALFFGRDSDIRAVVERLRADPFVLVTGDSGAGKSSLCRAGVLPAIAAGRLDDGIAWTSVQLVPHHRPLTTLASLLTSHLGLDEADTAKLLRQEPSRLARELRRTRVEGTGLVVFVDQLEELCTISDRDEVVAFAAVLAELAAGSPWLRLLATVRSDFLTRVAELPDLGTEIARAIYLLRPLSAEGAREAIVGPARAKGATLPPALVDTLVASVSDDRGGARIELPLLAFTLAQLWDARDPETQTISATSLEAIGGVRGALARHADGVLDRLLPEQRTAAKKILLRLVTPDKTRARRSSAELAGFDRAALDALVRGRLVVARGDDPPTFELAHERLIDGWPTFAGWVSNTTDVIAAHGRLATAVVDWERLGRARDGLWAARQLADLELLDPIDLTDTEASFASASRRAVARRRWLRRAIAVAIPVIAVSLFLGVRIATRRNVARHVAENVTLANDILKTARATSVEAAKLRADAYARFDAGEKASGETTWSRALQRGADAQNSYAQAARSLEAAFLLDTDRLDVRRELAEVTLERLQLAAREYRRSDRTELEARLGLYDPDGELAARLTAPGRLITSIEPANAETTILSTTQASLTLPAIAPGSYVLIASAPGRATVRIPFLITAGEETRLALALPVASAVPEGYVYVPAGSFLAGSRDDEFMRHFFDAAPMHERRTGAYLIARTEVTYAQWIEFLDALPRDQRAKHLPRNESGSATVGVGGEQLELRATDAGWELRFAPAGVAYVAASGAQLEYKERSSRKRQDWRQFPISGITMDDATAFAGWLDRTNRVPGARLCNELEWERAARGADGRAYPHGDQMAPDDTNIDATYGRREGGYGPDTVGSHPTSTSPFGLADASGNVWELMRTVGHAGYVMRGGGYFTPDFTAHLANRQEIPSTFRHLHLGFRVCAEPR